MACRRFRIQNSIIGESAGVRQKRYPEALRFGLSPSQFLRSSASTQHRLTMCRSAAPRIPVKNFSSVDIQLVYSGESSLTGAYSAKMTRHIYHDKYRIGKGFNPLCSTPQKKLTQAETTVEASLSHSHVFSTPPRATIPERMSPPPLQQQHTHVEYPDEPLPESIKFPFF